MTQYSTEKSGGKLEPLSKRLTENQENRRTYWSLTHSGHFQACAAVFSHVNSLLVPYRIYSIQQQKSQQIHIAQHLDFILYFALSCKSVCLLRNNETCHNNYEEDYSSIILVKPQLLPIHVNLWMAGCSMMSVAIFYIYVPSEVHYYLKPCSKKEVTCMFHHVCKLKN